MPSFEDAQALQTIAKFRKSDKIIACVSVLKMDGERADGGVTTIDISITGHENDERELLVPKGA